MLEIISDSQTLTKLELEHCKVKADKCVLSADLMKLVRHLKNYFLFIKDLERQLGRHLLLNKHSV